MDGEDEETIERVMRLFRVAEDRYSKARVLILISADLLHILYSLFFLRIESFQECHYVIYFPFFIQNCLLRNCPRL